MLYVRERRLWVWLAPQDESTEATLALSTNRKTMDGDKEFVELKEKLLKTSISSSFPRRRESSAP